MFEHSAANMTLLSLANMLPHNSGITWANVAYNLMFVTTGNIFAGAVFMALGYYYVSGPSATK